MIYQVQYKVCGDWIPGNLIMMEPYHLTDYLAFLAGERVVSGVMRRRKKAQSPTRLKRIEPDWAEETGYYYFDGENLDWVELVT